MFDEKMMHVEDGPDADKKQSFSKQDVIDIVNFDGSKRDAMKRFQIDKEQYDYFTQNFNREGKMLYRRNLDVISYE